MRIPQSKAASILCAAVVAAIPSFCKAATFTPLGFLISDTSDPNYATRTSQAEGVSGDGSTVVGWSTANSSDGTSHEGFVWTSSGGMVGIGNFPDGTTPYSSDAHGVNSDGSQVAGYGTDNNSNTIASRYATAGAGSFTNLGALGSTFQLSFANAISGDGNTVVGASYDNNFSQRPFFYRDSNSPSKILLLPGFGTTNQSHGGSANSVNSDGSEVVGQDIFHGINGANVGIQEGASVGALWAIDSTGVVSGPFELTDLPGTTTHYESSANGISATGNAAVGYGVAPVGTTLNVTQAVEWAITGTGGSTSVAAPQALGFIDNNTTNTADLSSVANATSKDGGIVVGQGLTTLHNSTPQEEAFIYFASGPNQGMHDLYDYLVGLTPSLSTVLSGWTLTDATGISSDGLTIIGEATEADPSNPQVTLTEAFVVKVPEPTCLPLLGLAAFGLRRRKPRITA